MTRACLFAACIGVLPFSSFAPAQTTQPSAEVATTQRSSFSRSAESEILFQEGLLRYSRGDLAAAESNFSELATEDSADAEAWYYLGLAQLDQGKTQPALESFNQSIRLDPTLTEARGPRATAFIRLQRYEEADQDINYLANDPRWAGMSDYLRGQYYYAKGDLKQAADYFGRAKAGGQIEQESAEFYEGLTYIRMRELVRARSTFRETGLGSDRDPTVAAAARQLDAVLANQQRGSKQFEAQISLSYEYDSNVILLGNNISTPDGISDQADSRVVLQPRGSYSLVRTPKWDFGIEGNAYLAWQFELNEFDIASYQAGPYVNYRVTDNLFASLRYGFNYLEYGHDPYLTRNLLTPQLTYIEKDFGYTSAYYQFQTRQFDDPGAIPQFDRDGQNHIFGLVQGIRLPEIFDGAGNSNIDLSYRFEHQETKGSDFDGNFHTVGATYYLPMPNQFRADFGVNAIFEGYKNPNSLDADGDKRDDTELSFVIGLTKDFGKGFSARIDYTYTDRSSNVTTAAGQKPYAYDRDILGVRFIYSY